VEIFGFILLAAAVIQFVYGIFLGYKWPQHIGPNTTCPFPGVSVVICAKNETENLQKNLPVILGQNYPDFEVLVVDDGSTDDTGKTLQQLKNQYPQLKSLFIPAAEKTGAGKKYALQKGVQNAAHAVILLTDADCVPASGNWIQYMVASLPGKQIVLGISPYLAEPGFLNALVEYETAVTAMQYVRYAEAGMPYMGVGRNMCFQKDIFLQKKWSAEEMQRPSGDDDLFIQSMADPFNTTTCMHPDAYTYSHAPITWQHWYRQKKRHLATGYQYSLKHRIVLGIFLISKLFFYLSFGILLVTGTNILFPAVVLLSYFAMITGLNFILQYFYCLNHRWYLSAIFDMAYVFSIIFTGIAGKIAPQKTWK
jgi:glycosyltransferase involved in cell wall biosynthesis